MCIKAVAEHYDLHWSTVKNIEKKHLEKKYKSISLKNVGYIVACRLYTHWVKNKLRRQIRNCNQHNNKM